GFTGIWLPPAYKGTGGPFDVGYGVYDMYDLGEFDQKGSVRTKYGTRDEYLRAVRALQGAGMQVYADVVLNHRMGGDEAEVARAVPYAQDDRLRALGPPREIKSYTHFRFPGRAGRYSPREWHWQQFDAVDYDALDQSAQNVVYLFEGKAFDNDVALEKGNYAFLMGCDLDFQSQEVGDEVTAWGKWYLDATGADGFRLDAVKHIAAWFFPDWLAAMEKHAGRELFAVGEYWSQDVGTLDWYVDLLAGRVHAFDVPLHYAFRNASLSGLQYDGRRLLDGTLMQQRPQRVVTFLH